MDEVEKHAARVRYWLKEMKSVEGDKHAIYAALQTASVAARRWMLAQPEPLEGHESAWRDVRSYENLAVIAEEQQDDETVTYHRARANSVAVDVFRYREKFGEGSS